MYKTLKDKTKFLLKNLNEKTSQLLRLNPKVDENVSQQVAEIIRHRKC